MFRIIHSKGFSKDELEQQKALVYESVIKFMAVMINARQKLCIAPTIRADDDEDASLILNKVNGNTDLKVPFDVPTRSALNCLWDDPSIKLCYERRHEFQLPDCAKYFLDEIDAISADDYVPTNQDVLYLRVATTGVQEVRFTVRKSTFRVFDVGGQRSERRKWIHCFDNVDAVIFIVALSEYDQVLLEDDNVNRIHEAQRLFQQICNCKAFANSVSMILFLNKRDVFAEKLQSRSIRLAFPDYEGSNDYDECLAYVEQLFKGLNVVEGKQLYCHETCATDTQQVRQIIDGVLDTVARLNMNSSGMR